jgi:carbamate kinase
MTQGQLGWLLSDAIGDALEAQGRERAVAAVVTQVVVDRDDPGFSNPTKPIGPFFSAGRAKRLAHARGWDVAEDAGRGWRRVVASPVPIEVVEWPQVRELLRARQVVIACGGGGIPVARGTSGLRGVEAVIDKDLAAALVGDLVKAKTLLLLTGVERVALDFATKRARWLDAMTLDEARGHLADGQFPAGSMGPKVDAAIRFVEGGGREAIITSLDQTAAALAGTTGTRITR